MATHPYRPSLIDFAFAVSTPRGKFSSADAAIPLPQGWNFDIGRKQLLLEPPSALFCEFRDALGSRRRFATAIRLKPTHLSWLRRWPSFSASTALN